MRVSAQIPDLYKPILDNQYLYYIYYGGRGAGKTENIAQILILLAVMERHRILCIREIQNTITESVKATLEKWVEKLHLENYFTITNKNIVSKNGSEFIFSGMQAHSAVNIKSISDITITWVEEAESFSKRSWELLVPSVIRTERPRIIVSFNPHDANDAIYADMIARKPPDNAYVRKVNYDENPFFKNSQLEAQMLNDKERLPDSEFKHKWLGELVTYSDASLFSKMDFAPLNLEFNRDNYAKIVIACDPATTDKEFSNEYGIIVAGLKPDGDAIILDDASSHYEPLEFAQAVDNFYKFYRADYAIVEVNNGGDFIKAMLLQVNPYINVKEVRAVRDKVMRASPVATLANVGKIRLNHTFTELERQLRLITNHGYLGSKGESPDRMDAMVWACYDLFGITDADTIWRIFEPKNFEIDSEYLEKAHVVVEGAIYCFFDSEFFNYVKFNAYASGRDYRMGVVKSWISDKFENDGNARIFLNENAITKNYKANFYNASEVKSNLLIQEMIPFLTAQKMIILDKIQNQELLRQCMEFNHDKEFHLLRCACEVLKNEFGG